MAQTATGDASAPLLRIEDLAVQFDGVTALDGVSFEVFPREIVGIIGPNGAGKTTLFNCLSRFYKEDRGDIAIAGRSIVRTPPHRIVTLGLSRTFQNLALFDKLSVLDNVMLGGHRGTSGNVLSDALQLPSVRRRDARMEAAAWELLRYLNLEAVAHRHVGDLPFGTQKRVEIARALAASPKLLLLDEPAGGLNHQEVKQLGSLILRIREERDVAVLLVEHHMGLVMSISDRVVVLNFGRLIAQGKPKEITQNPDVIRAYLGAPAA
ncbi:MAG TPA: ABC transporter ATP-binding protein [Methylovirgula sp.]|nr:ABC transporter ATP-binding protein [Methylovirgula sp.]